MKKFLYIGYSMKTDPGMLRDIDKPLVGWLCTYTPEEILLAGGIHPYRILPDLTSAATDSYLDSNFCPYVRNCLGQGLQGMPLQGLIVVNSCDGMRRLYDAWNYYLKTPFVYFLDLPHFQSDRAVEYYRRSLIELIKALEGHFAVKITEDSLAQAIATCNHTRRLLKRLYQSKDRLSLSGPQIFEIMKGATLMPKEDFNRQLQKLLDETPMGEGARKDSIRILLVGTLLDDPNLIELIEEFGGEVVWEDMCTGSRYFEDLVDTKGDPLSAISRRYLLKTPCPRMKDANKRLEHIAGLVKSYKIHGVILYALKFCDTFLYDIAILKKRLDVPSLVLEGDCTPGTLGRVRTRVQAFLEMLQYGYAGSDKTSV